jgi:ElaB/YqjD/DUF883 family membrane-anchored ribosome-binding protein
MTTIQDKLDMLAEFYSQKDALELRKRELLNEIQVPAEIEQIVKDGLVMAQRIELDMRVRVAAYDKTIDAELAAVSIPAELKAALAELDAQRAALMEQFADVEKQRQIIAGQKRDNEAAEFEHLKADRAQLEEEVKSKTAQVYADVASRKNEIEIEFSGKAQDADENIKKLEAEIKAEVKAAGASVKGKFFHAVYVKGRVTWNTDKMDAWVIDHPFLKEARKEGEPSITLRRI